MKQSVKILLIEDDQDDCVMLKEYLSRVENFSFDITWESKAARARDLIVTGAFDIFLIDYRLGGETGLDLIQFIQEQAVLTPCILLTGQDDLRVDLDASRLGAADYLVKTALSAPVLERSIRYALKQASAIRQLAEKEERYRSLFERSIDPIFLADENLMLIDANPAFLDFFGLAPDTVLKAHTQPISALFFYEKDYDVFKNTLNKTEQIKDFELVFSHHGGDHKIGILNCVHIPEGMSDLCCYQGIIHDLTMWKKAEKDLLVAERLSVTGKIARTVAHEIRNPLTSLNLAMEHLKETICDTDDMVEYYCGVIERNAGRIEVLITQMLNASKPDVLNLEPTSINTILEDTLEEAIDRINLHGILLHRSFEPGLPAVPVDREKIKVAFLNIIINAIEAMPAGEGALSIITEESTDAVVVTIADNGKGISADQKDKLFDPFYSEKPGGTGLGLTSTRNIITSHEATVDIDSELNKGTSFIISFKRKALNQLLSTQPVK